MKRRTTWFERNARAEELEQLGRHEEALVLYRQNVEEGCTISFTYVRMAAIHRRRGEHAQESEALRQAVAIEQDRGPSKRLVQLKKDLKRAEGFEERSTVKPAAGTGQPAPESPRSTRRHQGASTKKSGCLSTVLVVILAGALLRIL